MRDETKTSSVPTNVRAVHPKHEIDECFKAQKRLECLQLANGNIGHAEQMAAFVLGGK